MKAHRTAKISLATPFLALSLAGRALAWGPDIAVTTNEGFPKEATGAPSMVATSSRGLFMVRDNATNDCFDIMRSRDSGLSWYQFFWYCGGSSNIQGHQVSIVVPEKSQDFMYVAFTEGGTEIWLLKVDLTNPSSWSSQVIASITPESGVLSTPKIISDNHDFTYYYLYVSYVRSSYFTGSHSEQAALQVSTSKGASWETPQYFSSTGAPTGSAQCDVAYGRYKVYFTYTDSFGAYVVTSPDYGYTWRNLMPL